MSCQISKTAPVAIRPRTEDNEKRKHTQYRRAGERRALMSVVNSTSAAMCLLGCSQGRRSWGTWCCRWGCPREAHRRVACARISWRAGDKRGQTNEWIPSAMMKRVCASSAPWPTTACPARYSSGVWGFEQSSEGYGGLNRVQIEGTIEWDGSLDAVVLLACNPALLALPVRLLHLIQSRWTHKPPIINPAPQNKSTHCVRLPPLPCYRGPLFAAAAPAAR